MSCFSFLILNDFSLFPKSGLEGFIFFLLIFSKNEIFILFLFSLYFFIFYFFFFLIPVNCVVLFLIY